MRAVTPEFRRPVMFNGADGSIDLLSAGGEDLRVLRTKIQMVFQDPVSSLSPRMTGTEHHR